MILVDTSVIVAWIDPTHEHHESCESALTRWAGEDELAVSAVTFAELAVGGRAKESLNEVLAGFTRLDIDSEAAFRAGQAFGRWHPGRTRKSVLPDFLIRGQAAVLGIPHLTTDRHQIQAFPEVDFLFP